MQKKIEDQTVLLKKTDSKIAQLINAQKQISDNQDKINLLDLAVPDNFDYFSYAKRMDILATNDNVKLESIIFPGAVLAGDKNIGTIPKEKTKVVMTPNPDGTLVAKTNFIVSGDQKSVLSFLSDLENMDRVALIQSIDISKTQKSATEIKQSLSVSGVVSFYTFSTNDQKK